ncbi:GNAT family N-acetyltransferase [Oceanirhabdus sp. W0125-5]|uniref:GNAT family N-acetyltransferase n=1 Tax=Oceanirhabdus sp. W0125-5 TaxID=2999116 RepID=UPI0022F2B679|nr:GNAT family N-acetyltransferase [Oceanirhabdus sp. W0125-5]WBW96496.1 GNAT family N-acetyltransferase [Oceanirhabdus sp. W0125-5]
MKEITVRILTAADIDMLCDFEENARITEPDIWMEDFNKEDFRSKLLSLDIDTMMNNKIFIALENNKIVGRCDLMLMTSLMDFYKSGYIDWIYILKNKRGSGIAHSLIYYIENYLKSEDYKYYYLFTASNDQAQKFYHSQNRSFNISIKEIAEKDL